MDLVCLSRAVAHVVFFEGGHMARGLGDSLWPPGLFSAADWGTIGGPSSRIRTTGACEAAQTQVRSLHRRASNPPELGSMNET